MFDGGCVGEQIGDGGCDGGCVGEQIGVKVSASGPLGRAGDVVSRVQMTHEALAAVHSHTRSDGGPAIVQGETCGRTASLCSRNPEGSSSEDMLASSGS